MTASSLRPLTLHNRRRRISNIARTTEHDDSSIMKSKEVPLKVKETTPEVIDWNSSQLENREDSHSRDERDDIDVFRSQSSWLDSSSGEEWNDMWTLKRANPILSDDSEDELEEEYASPSKRTCLSWDNRIDDETSIFFRPIDP